MSPPGGGGGLGLIVTDLARKVMTGLFVLYVLQLVASEWMGLAVMDLLAWHWPLSSGFMPWQPLTSFLLHGSVGTFFFEMLALVFFFGPTELAMGRRDLLRGLGFTLVVSILFAFLTLVTGAALSPSTHAGLYPLTAALIVFYGLLMPNRTVLLMFVLPVRAVWFAWGTLLISFLYFLAFRGHGNAVALGAAVGAFGWIRLLQHGGAGAWWQATKKEREKKKIEAEAKRRIEEAHRRFDVIEGGGEKSNGGGKPWYGGGTDDDGGPIIH